MTSIRNFSDITNEIESSIAYIIRTNTEVTLDMLHKSLLDEGYDVNMVLLQWTIA